MENIEIKSPKVSVVVRAYNVEKYILECLESLCNQTLKDIEILVCEDCSTDGTLDIAKSVAEKDSRVKILAKDKNQGTLLNRKSGVDAATGEYVMFLDGDDYYSTDACERAYNAIKEQNTDILQFGTNVFAEKDGFEDFIKGVKEYLKYPEEKIIVPVNGGLLSYKYVKEKMNFNIFSKIYKIDTAKKAFENIPQQRLNMREDLLQVYLMLFFAGSYGYIKNEIYNYRVGNGISTSTEISDSKLEALAKSYYVYLYLNEWTEKQGGTEICADRLNEIKMQMLDATAATALKKMSAEKRQQYVDLALRNCPAEEFLAYLSYSVYSLKNHREDEFSELIRTVNIFKPGLRKFKTLGTFYHRMYNGGIERVVSRLTDIWNEGGYNVVLFTDDEPNENDYKINPNTVRVVLPKIQFRSYDEYYARAVALIGAINEYNIDIMIYHAWENLNKLADVRAVKFTGLPFLMHTHGTFCSSLRSNDFQYAYRAATMPFIFRCVDGVTALNDVDCRWWQSKGLRCYKTVNPIDISPDTTPAKLEGKNVIISARIDRGKQIEDVVEIAKLVRREIPDVKFTIIGGCDDDIYGQKITGLIKEYGLTDTVETVGYVKDVISYYQSADVMLSTSRFEGFSLALAEGKVCGLPLVCYFLANWDMARNPRGMVNIPQGDICGAAREIVKLLTDDDYRYEMGRQARESGIEFVKTDIGKIWDDIFKDMAENEYRYQDGIVIKEPLAAATDILAEFAAKGIERRSAGKGFDSEELSYYKLQCNHLAETINEIRSSTSYKIGMAVTAFFRKIKMILHK